jgi:hypothetical protein
MQKKLNASFGFDDNDANGSHAAAPRAAKVRYSSLSSNQSSLATKADAFKQGAVLGLERQFTLEDVIGPTPTRLTRS